MLRVGFDLVACASVRDALDTHGERYLRRVYTEAERADCCGGGVAAISRLAARFAAKEATFKVLGVGDRPVGWRDVELRRNLAGREVLLLTGAAATMARDARVHAFSVSVMHHRGCAGAIVIAEIKTDADP